jgi:CO/xanthine dehydrogenase Mo-binding subunit
VALLVGPDLARLEEYASQTSVEAEALPPSPDTVFQEQRFRLGEAETGQETAHTAAHVAAQNTDPDSEVLRRVYRTGIQTPCAGPHGAIALLSGETVLIHTATQCPDHVARSVSAILSINQELVQVEPSCLGLYLDGKSWYPSLIACHAALGAFITGKPVKLVLTREEDFRYSPKSNETAIELCGRLEDKRTELDMTIRVTMGAAAVFTDTILDRLSLGCLGAYRYSAVRLEAYALKTGIPPQGPHTGFGMPAAFFAIERHVSSMADALRQDPAQWRKKRLLRRNEHLPSDQVREAAPESLIDAVAAMGDYYRKWASYELLRSHRRLSEWNLKDEPLRGIGIALAFQPDDAGPYSWGAAVVEVSIDLGEPKLRGIWLSVDGGALDEEQARRSLKRSAIHAVSWAMGEGISYHEGRLDAGFFYNNDMVQAPGDIPPIHIGFIRNDDKNGDPRAIGELPFSTIPAAYVQAVSQAMDHCFDHIPLSAGDIWQADDARLKGDAETLAGKSKEALS